MGSAGLSPDEQATLRRVAEFYGQEQRGQQRSRVLAEYPLEPGLSAAFVPVERRHNLPVWVLPGPAGSGPRGERWEARAGGSET